MERSFDRKEDAFSLLIIFIAGLALVAGLSQRFTSRAQAEGAISSGVPVATQAAVREKLQPSVLPAAETPGACGSTPIRHAGTYPMESLANRSANDLFGWFLGTQGRFPQTLVVDWDNTLDRLWSRKIEMSGGNSTVRTTGSTLVTEYHTCDAGLTTLVDYQRHAKLVSRVLYDNLDWQALGAKRFQRKDADRRLKLLMHIANSFDGRKLVAYQMTELLPQGSYNRPYLDFMLRYGGRRYLESLPALHDNITSFGPGQFTQYAVYDVGKEKRGASLVSVHLPESLRIPGSTGLLRGDHHLKAAWLFGVHNLATLVANLNTRQLANLEAVVDKKDGDVLQYIATAHNKPAVALPSALRWLDNKARLPFYVSCPRASRIYATKTIANYESLDPDAD